MMLLGLLLMYNIVSVVNMIMNKIQPADQVSQACSMNIEPAVNL